MKCLLINGSPNRGNTYTLAMTAIKHLLLKADFQFEEIHLTRRQIPLCEGCYCCFERGDTACLHRPLFADIVTKIESADALFILSPAYSKAVTPHLKNFIDHLAYLMLRPRYFEKKAFVITTSMGKSSAAITGYIKEILHAWGVNHVMTFSVACHLTRGYYPAKKVVNHLERLADVFYDDVKSERLHQPSFVTLKHYNASRAKAFVISQSRLSKFWKEHGMLDAPYFPIIKINLPKRLFGWAVFKFFLHKHKKLLKDEQYAMLSRHF